MRAALAHWFHLLRGRIQHVRSALAVLCRAEAFSHAGTGLALLALMRRIAGRDRRARAGAILVFAVLFECSVGGQTRPELPEEFDAHPGQGSGELRGYGDNPCPVSVPLVEVSRVPIEGGMAVVFTSGAAPRDELLWRVEHFAEEYAARKVGDRKPGPVPFATETTLRLVPAGVRLELTARDPLYVDVLREHVQARTQWMVRTGECGAS